MAENEFGEVQAAMKRADDALRKKLDDGAEFVMPARSVEVIASGISVMIASGALPGVKDMLIKAREELYQLMKEGADG
jgi:hypothetical protein